MNTLRPIFAIFFALVLTVTGHSMAVARGANDVTGQMVLCTGTGPVTVYMDADGVPTAAPHICPDCVLTALIAVDMAVLAMPWFDRYVVAFASEGVSTDTIFEIPSYLSRAPPRLV